MTAPGSRPSTLDELGISKGLPGIATDITTLAIAPSGGIAPLNLASVLDQDQLWTVLWALRDYQVEHLRHGVQCRRYEAEGGMPPKYGTESWGAAADRAEQVVVSINAVVAKLPEFMAETFHRAVAEEMAR